MKKRLRGSVLLALMLVLVVLAAACSSGEDEGNEGDTSSPSADTASQAPAETESGPTTDATLTDFAIALGSSQLTAGEVTFNVTNNGPSEHEMVVIKTDDAPDALPTKSDGTVDEEGAGLEPIGEVEEVAPGDSTTLALELDPGHYVAICNIAGHYAEGMATEFTVK